MNAINEDGFINIKFSNDEALVLWEWLRRFNEEDNQVEDQAEERVLWDMEALLEKNASGLFSDDYADVLSKARKNVRD